MQVFRSLNEPSVHRGSWLHPHWHISFFRPRGGRRNPKFGSRQCQSHHQGSHGLPLQRSRSLHMPSQSFEPLLFGLPCPHQTGLRYQWSVPRTHPGHPGYDYAHGRRFRWEGSCWTRAVVTFLNHTGKYNFRSDHQCWLQQQWIPKLKDMQRVSGSPILMEEHRGASGSWCLDVSWPYTCFLAVGETFHLQGMLPIVMCIYDHLTFCGSGTQKSPAFLSNQKKFPLIGDEKVVDGKLIDLHTVEINQVASQPTRLILFLHALGDPFIIIPKHFWQRLPWKSNCLRLRLDDFVSTPTEWSPSSSVSTHAGWAL